MGYTTGRRLTPEFMQQEALKYKTRTEFQYFDGSCYSTARKIGIFEEICKHMRPASFSIPQKITHQILNKLLREKSFYNTKKIIYPFELDVYYDKFKLAIEYSGKGWHSSEEVQKRDLEKIQLCKDRDICLITIAERSRYYEMDIKNQLVENLEIINGRTSLNFKEEDIRNIIVDYKMVYSHSYIIDGNGEVDLDFLKKLMSKVDSIAEFQKVYPTFYEGLRQLELLHLLDDIRTVKNYTDEEIFEITSKIESYHDFVANYSNIYQVAHRRGILNEVSSHMIKIKHDPYSCEEIESIAKQFTKRNQFATAFPSAYDKARRLNILDQLFPKIDENTVREKSKNVKGRKEFKKNYYVYWKRANELGILDDILPTKSKSILYPEEMVRQEAKNCLNKKEFKQKFLPLYQKARYLKILDELFIE